MPRADLAGKCRADHFLSALNQPYVRQTTGVFTGFDDSDPCQRFEKNSVNGRTPAIRLQPRMAFLECEHNAVHPQPLFRAPDYAECYRVDLR